MGGRTDRQTDGQTTDQLWYEINYSPFFRKEKEGTCITIIINMNIGDQKI